MLGRLRTSEAPSRQVRKSGRITNCTAVMCPAFSSCATPTWPVLGLILAWGLSLLSDNVRPVTGQIDWVKTGKMTRCSASMQYVVGPFSSVIGVIYALKKCWYLSFSTSYLYSLYFVFLQRTLKSPRWHRVLWRIQGKPFTTMELVIKCMIFGVSMLRKTHFKPVILHRERWKQNKVVSFILLNASLSAH